MVVVKVDKLNFKLTFPPYFSYQNSYFTCVVYSDLRILKRSHIRIDSTTRKRDYMIPKYLLVKSCWVLSEAKFDLITILDKDN